MVYITPARNVGTRIVGTRIFILFPRFFNCLVYITSLPGGIPGFYIKSSVFLNYLVYIILAMDGNAGRIGSALMKYLFMKYILDHQLRGDGFFGVARLRMTEEVLS